MATSVGRAVEFAVGELRKLNPNVWLEMDEDWALETARRKYHQCHGLLQQQPQGLFERCWL
jgi:hypothetical protein